MASHEGSSVPLTLENVTGICSILTGAVCHASDWEGLASQLRINDPKRIRVMHPQRPALCLEETIRQWLHEDPEASWEKLSTAVSQVEGYGKGTKQTILSRAINAASPEDSSVQAKVNEFELQFERLTSDARSEIEEKETSLKTFRHSLTCLPIRVRSDHLLYIQEKLDDIKKADSIEDLFLTLNLYWSFLDYSLLEHIIQRYGSSDLKRHMSQYVKDMVSFRQTTTVGQLIRIWPGRVEPPPNFSQVTSKLNKNASEYTLEELEKLRRRFCSQYRLSDCVLMLAGGSSNSVIMFWYIPSSLASELTVAVSLTESSFFEQLGVLKLEVDGFCAFEQKYTTESSSTRQDPQQTELVTDLLSQVQQLQLEVEELLARLQEQKTHPPPEQKNNAKQTILEVQQSDGSNTLQPSLPQISGKMTEDKEPAPQRREETSYDVRVQPQYETVPQAETEVRLQLQMTRQLLKKAQLALQTERIGAALEQREAQLEYERREREVIMKAKKALQGERVEFQAALEQREAQLDHERREREIIEAALEQKEAQLKEFQAALEQREAQLDHERREREIIEAALEQKEAQLKEFQAALEQREAQLDHERREREIIEKKFQAALEQREAQLKRERIERESMEKEFQATLKQRETQLEHKRRERHYGKGNEGADEQNGKGNQDAASVQSDAKTILQEKVQSDLAFPPKMDASIIADMMKSKDLQPQDTIAVAYSGTYTRMAYSVQPIIIADVMENKDVTTDEIPRESHFDPDTLGAIHHSKRYFRAKGFAMFEYHGAGCHHTWASAHAWCIIDLKTQRIVYKFGQDCQICNGSAQPEFEEDAIKRMAEWAVDTYLRRSGRVEYDPFRFDSLRDALDGDDTRGPHDEERCNMCRRLGHRCCD